MKYVNGLIECSQINGNRRRTDSAGNQARNLGGNRVRRGGKDSSGRLIAKSRSSSASTSLKPYLHGSVQTAVAGVVAPEGNNGADSIVLQQRHKGFGLAPIVRAKTQDVVAGNCEGRRRATLADHKNIMRIRERLDYGYFGTGLRPDDDLDATSIEVLNSVERTR